MLGLVEDFGTGIPNLFKYCKIYTGFEPIIFDEDRFKFILNHNFFENNEEKFEEKVPQLSTTVQERILEFCTTPKSTNEIAEFLQLKSKKNVLNRIIKPLLVNSLLSRTAPDKIHSPNQKYISNR